MGRGLGISGDGGQGVRGCREYHSRVNSSDISLDEESKALQLETAKHAGSLAVKQHSRECLGFRVWLEWSAGDGRQGGLMVGNI